MKPPMHLLMVTRSLPFHCLGGMEVVAWDLARAFVELGVKVSVVTTSCDGLPGDSTLDGVNIVCLRAPSARYSNQWWRLSRAIYRNRYSASVDAVLSVSAGAMSMAREQSSTRPLFLVQAHGSSWGELVSKVKQSSPLAMLKAARNVVGMVKDTGYRRFDAFVAVGPAVQRDLVTHPTRAIVGGRPVHAIANGVDPQSFAFDANARTEIRQQLGIGEDDKVVLSASRLHPQKGVLEGLEAFASAASILPNLHYLIAGSGAQEGKLRARSIALKIGSRVHFLGHVPRDRMRGVLSASDLFLFPTMRSEGLPMNVLEALASGLPVAVSIHIDDPRFSAIAVDPRKQATLVDAIVSTPVQKDRFSRLPAEFSLAHSAKQYIALIERMQALVAS